MKKPTLTIGVPAHNEEKNIKTLIQSVLMQRGDFELEEVIVALDGCTDRTEKIVRRLHKIDKRVSLLANHGRKGKAARLNQILEKNASSYIAFIDADIVLARDCEFDHMLKAMKSNKNINVVAARQIPYSKTTFVGRISNASFNAWYQITSSVNDGNQIHNLHGSASLLKRRFAITFRFPSGVVSDQGYLYLSATKNNKDGFALAKDTKVIFRMVSSLKDARKQGTRAIFDDKKDMAKYFGNDVYERYKIPMKNKIYGLGSGILQNPFYTIAAVLLGIYIRRHPYKSGGYEKRGAWSSVATTKMKIIL